MNLYLLYCAGRFFAKLAPSHADALQWGRIHFQSDAVHAVLER